MDFIFKPWHLCLVILAGWVNRQQQELIDYLLAENRVLKEKLGKGRILLTDDQRRRLAVKGRVAQPERRYQHEDVSRMAGRATSGGNAKGFGSMTRMPSSGYRR